MRFDVGNMSGSCCGNWCIYQALKVFIKHPALGRRTTIEEGDVEMARDL